MVIIDLVSMIVRSPTIGTSTTANMNPIDAVGLSSIIIGMIVCLYFAVTISYSSYKRKKEMEARIAEWEKGEQERRRKVQEALSKIPERQQTA
jgi:uncharacterized membrane protein (DUF106 family)